MTADQTDQLLERAAAALRRAEPRDRLALESTLEALRHAGPARSQMNAIGRIRLPDVRAVDVRHRVTGGSPLRFVAGLAAGLAFAAGLGIGLAAGWRMRGASSVAADAMGDSRAVAGTRGAGTTTAVVRPVQFMLVAPAASRVALVGEFNDWDPAATPMSAAPGGVWHVALPLANGRHLYAFVVDGTVWVTDPLAPLAPERWFGTRNSVVLVRAEVGS